MNFGKEMLSDSRIRELVDYPAASEVFPGVEIKAGVCYFLRDSSHKGCALSPPFAAVKPWGRCLATYGEYDVFVRDGRAVSILHKVLSHNEASINGILARDKEFGWTSNFDGFHAKEKNGDVPLHYIRTMKRGVGFISEKITKIAGLIDTWKVLVPQAYNGGDGIPHRFWENRSFAASPSACTQSFLFFY